MSEDTFDRRHDQLKNYFIHKEGWVYVVLAFLIWLGYHIRTLNLSHLIDVVTGNYVLISPDDFVFLRYAREILTQGYLSSIDMMRYYPLGYEQIGEFGFLSHFIVYLYKFLHFFSSSVTLEYAQVIYPPLVFCVSLIFFFLLVRRLFNNYVGLMATAFLTVLTPYLFRTIAGYSDKESFGLFFMMLALYLFACSWKTDNLKNSLLFAGLSGLSTALMGLAWGGVQFVFLIIGVYGLIEIILNKFSDVDLFSYSLWSFTSSFLLILLLPVKYSLFGFLSSVTTAPIFLTVLCGFVMFLSRKGYLSFLDTYPHKLRVPPNLFLFFLSFAVVLLLLLFTQGVSFFSSQFSNIVDSLVQPFGSGGRWGLTVAESAQPYVRDWIGQFGTYFFWLFLIASVVLFFVMVRKIKEYAWHLTLSYVLFLFAFVFSRYSPDSIFNGLTPLAKILFLGSLILFLLGIFVFILWSYRHNEHVYKELLSLDKFYTLVFVWFFMMLVAARNLNRLILMLAPIAAILVAYLFWQVVQWSNSYFKEKNYRYGVLVFAAVLFGLLFSGLYSTTVGIASAAGSSYTPQWQIGMDWVQKNTPQDAVFAHWWDYGYWVQTGGGRATISDGGNSRSAINHFTARYLLTAPNETDALKFLKANEATHVLMVVDEIGKYPAFSSIGADKNYDRYSWIQQFALNPQLTQETRNTTLFVYQGMFPLDDDFLYQGTLLPRRHSGIVQFVVPISQNGNDVIFGAPTAVVAYNNKPIQVPVRCLFYQGKEYTFDVEGFDGCLMLIPQIISSNQGNPVGAVLYLSRDVRYTLFTQLFLFGKESEYFRLVYSDHDKGYPLASYQGRIIGPLKIWEATIPHSVPDVPWMRGKELPDPDVNTIKWEYQ